MMQALVWMSAAAAGAWLAVTAATGGRANPEALLGAPAPLAVAAVTWIVTERTWRRAPERLTRVAIMGFAVRMVLFAAYVVTMVQTLALRPEAFVAGFLSGVVAVYAVEAVFLRRLLRGASRSHVST
jgi:hypothetical protein